MSAIIRCISACDTGKSTQRAKLEARMQKWQSHLEQEHPMFKNLTAIANFTALLNFASPVCL
jgi:hypothetical protein